VINTCFALLSALQILTVTPNVHSFKYVETNICLSLSCKLTVERAMSLVLKLTSANVDVFALSKIRHRDTDIVTPHSSSLFKSKETGM
jgi:hypothetical protein